MAAVINPPNTPLIDGSGRVVPEWYRFFASLNREVQSNTNIVVEQTIFGDGTTPIIADSTGDVAGEASLLPPFVVADQIDDILPPIVIEPDPVDLSPYAVKGGASSLNIRTITATGSPAADDYTILGNATGGAITINLPAASTSGKRILAFKKIDASPNAVTIDPNGAETVDGAATLALTTQYQSAVIQCDGSSWWKL